MSERKIAIFMTVDDKDTSESSGTRLVKEKAGQYHGADETYRVIVNAADHKRLASGTSLNDSMADTAAHELGHVLSAVFKMPGGMLEDPRQKGEFNNVDCAHCAATPEQAARVQNNEKMAWDIAEKIRPELSQGDRAASLATYDNWGFNDRPEVQAESRERARQKRQALAEVESIIAGLDKLLANIEEKEQMEKAVKTLQPA